MLYDDAAGAGMPRKIRELEAELQRAGFVRVPGKGSHRKWVHPKARVTMSGKPGDDAKRYQEKEVREAIERAQR
jgi:predicted RNA binding protein YcfA (HicA-like mRNA interferase family)